LLILVVFWNIRLLFSCARSSLGDDENCLPSYGSMRNHTLNYSFNCLYVWFAYLLILGPVCDAILVSSRGGLVVNVQDLYLCSCRSLSKSCRFATLRLLNKVCKLITTVFRATPTCSNFAGPKVAQGDRLACSLLSNLLNNNGAYA
jgi:hypothetical protein